MALELNKLANQVNQMGRTMAERQVRYVPLIEQARAKLADHSVVSPELRDRSPGLITATNRGAAPTRRVRTWTTAVLPSPTRSP